VSNASRLPEESLSPGVANRFVGCTACGRVSSVSDREIAASAKALPAAASPFGRTSSPKDRTWGLYVVFSRFGERTKVRGFQEKKRGKMRATAMRAKRSQFLIVGHSEG
jgi:hypothetical protein